jgi:hypothetical protein
MDTTLAPRKNRVPLKPLVKWAKITSRQNEGTRDRSISPEDVIACSFICGKRNGKLKTKTKLGLMISLSQVTSHAPKTKISMFPISVCLLVESLGKSNEIIKYKRKKTKFRKYVDSSNTRQRQIAKMASIERSLIVFINLCLNYGRKLH